jgi:acyl carrier protein
MSADDERNIDIAAVSKLRDWVVLTKPQTVEIGLDTHLINEGVLDSFEMVNFLLYIEEIRGQEIPEALVQPRYFTSLRMIHDTFFRV